MWLFPTYRETPELTFMEVYDVRWVTNFDEKMAEIGGASKKGEYYDLPLTKTKFFIFILYFFFIIHLITNRIPKNVSYEESTLLEDKTEDKHKKEEKSEKSSSKVESKTETTKS